MLKRMACAWMALRDCLVPPSDRRREMQEVVVADLHTCLEQLQSRTLDMENKITRCGEQAMFHMQQAQKAGISAPARQRDRQRAKTHMEERRRLQQQLDKATLMSVAIKKQIDSIVSSHMDMLIVDAMRGFNYAATNMALPQRSTEVEHLGEELVDRQGEVAAMQEAIMGIGVNMMTLNQTSSQGTTDTVEEDSELWSELEDLMHHNSAAPTTHNYNAEINKDKEEEEEDINEKTVLLPNVPLTRAYQRQILLSGRRNAAAAESSDNNNDDMITTNLQEITQPP